MRGIHEEKTHTRNTGQIDRSSEKKKATLCLFREHYGHSCTSNFVGRFVPESFKLVW